MSLFRSLKYKTNVTVKYKNSKIAQIIYRYVYTYIDKKPGCMNETLKALKERKCLDYR